MAMLESAAVGAAIEARADGQPVSLGACKQRLVLAILALEANHQVPVDRLVDLVWPEEQPRTTTHPVRVCVSGLRAVGGGGGGQQVGLVVGAAWSGAVASVRAAGVVVLHVFVTYAAQVRVAEDQHPVGALGQDGPDELSGA